MLSPFLLVALAPISTLTQGASQPTPPPATTPALTEERKYRLLFMRLGIDERDADKAQAEGKVKYAEGLRTELQKVIGLTDEQFADLKRIMEANRKAQGAINEKVKALQEEGRSKVPAGTRPRLDPVALQALDAESDQAVRDRIQEVKAALGQGGMAKLEAFFTAMHRSVTMPASMPPPKTPAELEAQRTAGSQR